MAYLGRSGTDAVVARLVLERAEEIRVERDREIVKATGRYVGHEVARMLAKIFK